MYNTAEMKAYRSRIVHDFTVKYAVISLKSKNEDSFNYDEEVINSIKSLPLELQFEILLNLTDYQLLKLENEFRDIIHSDYFIKKRVKSSIAVFRAANHLANTAVTKDYQAIYQYKTIFQYNMGIVRSNIRYSR